MVKRWYVVHVYSGFEGKVKHSLEERIASSPLKEYFGEIIVPTETVVELVKGERKESSRKFYPGYILVQMALTDLTWHLVKDTGKVTGFLGGRDKPSPITDAEVEQILRRMEAGKQKPQPKYHFEPGDEIRVIDGPFTNFNGTVEEVNPEKGKIKVFVSIFGRSTPVELEFVQVTKL
ncbi:transcription termination/antitermination protein NusG [Desulfobotulus sp. H1]|uniref:Transcription termination/antitermination protein NusG n=1 Tax=Desulfobotulus pelophilus TaxID=2823377 RepID=A0ABT3N4P1_9BACT|nr:transcription termination/antitermination protein NusG [Desulfobotulus pelophilus]MCW7752426.1 transcription termination/antitermination protein NusG [Desulfobotulus pelophilus]